MKKVEKRSNLRIYLDLDEVLSDFVGMMCQLHNVDEQRLHTYRTSLGWDCRPSFGAILTESQRPLTSDEFWKPVRDYPGGEVMFWRNLPKLPWFDELLEMIVKYDPVFKIVSSPSRSIDAHTGKLFWIHDNIKQMRVDSRFNSVCARRVRIISEKEELSQSGRVLVDDRPDTIIKWKQAGGHGICFPSGSKRWVDALNPVEIVERELAYASQDRQAYLDTIGTY